MLRAAPLFGLPVLLLGCTPPGLLIHPDDRAFAQAQERLDAMTDRVEASEAPRDERTLFLQAEALYEYRFAFPPRSAVSRLAQAAAAATDFPALQSLATSLDLADLRMSEYDGSIHLWETLLDHHPDTPLRALALYRLGFAYRNTSVSGFPRKSGDEAFDELIADFPGTELATLAEEAKVLPWKSRKRATALSLLPGLGQFYVGRWRAGAFYMGVGLTAAAVVAWPIYVGYQRRRDLTWKRDWPLLAAGLGGTIIISIDYTSAYQDAVRGAVQYNERVETDFRARHPGAP